MNGEIGEDNNKATLVEKQSQIDFPFVFHKAREDEPQQPDYSFLHVPTTVDVDAWDENRWDNAQDDPNTIERAWLNWAQRQPDGQLLLAEWSQRSEWKNANGKIPEERIEEWRETRQKLARIMRVDGQEEIIKQYWPNNSELQENPGHQ